MFMTAWVVQMILKDRPVEEGQSVLMRGDNVSAVSWTQQVWGVARQARSLIMRLMGTQGKDGRGGTSAEGERLVIALTFGSLGSGTNKVYQRMWNTWKEARAGEVRARGSARAMGWKVRFKNLGGRLGARALGFSSDKRRPGFLLRSGKGCMGRPEAG
ncbi:unnamed protein product [Ectocarpus sp. CCAP 1310/34]|nr:unnamed protein product [Ectocarpus sp. CCAP 1310/34]